MFTLLRRIAFGAENTNTCSEQKKAQSPRFAVILESLQSTGERQAETSLLAPSLCLGSRSVHIASQNRFCAENTNTCSEQKKAQSPRFYVVLESLQSTGERQAENSLLAPSLCLGSRSVHIASQNRLCAENTNTCSEQKKAQSPRFAVVLESLQSTGERQAENSLLAPSLYLGSRSVHIASQNRFCAENTNTCSEQKKAQSPRFAVVLESLQSTGERQAENSLLAPSLCLGSRSVHITSQNRFCAENTNTCSEQKKAQSPRFYVVLESLQSTGERQAENSLLAPSLCLGSRSVHIASQNRLCAENTNTCSEQKKAQSPRFAVVLESLQSTGERQAGNSLLAPSLCLGSRSVHIASQESLLCRKH